jgi:hypothetical protein
VTRRWIHELLGAETFERLATHLSGSQLSSVLLEVMQHRAAARTPSEVLAQYERDPFCRPAQSDLRTALDVERHLLAAAADFEAIDLPPVAPLATCSSVAPTAQNRVLSALRSTEVVADPTNVLALECAHRLRAAPAAAPAGASTPGTAGASTPASARAPAPAPVHLATCQRVIRAQPFPKLPGYAAHFRIFVLASGGIETVDHAFTAATLTHHIHTMLAALDRLEQHGYAFGERHIDLLATPARAALADRIAAALAPTPVQRKPLEHPYYSAGLRYMLWVTAPDGTPVPLGDGGAFDWLTKLTSNRRAVYIASGAGAQLIPLRFRRA